MDETSFLQTSTEQNPKIACATPSTSGIFNS